MTVQDIARSDGNGWRSPAPGPDDLVTATSMEHRKRPGMSVPSVPRRQGVLTPARVVVAVLVAVAGYRRSWSVPAAIRPVWISATG